MFHKKKEKQQKPKKLRVYTANSRKPAVIAMWLLFVCGFAFAVYKNFTAIDTHTVHEKEIVERRVEDTSGVEAFVRNFAKTYYSWSNNKDSVAQRTDALTGYLTEDLQRLTADTVKLYPACTKQPSTRTITAIWLSRKHRRLSVNLQNLHIRQKPQNPMERFLRRKAEILRIF